MCLPQHDNKSWHHPERSKEGPEDVVDQERVQHIALCFTESRSRRGILSDADTILKRLAKSTSELLFVLDLFNMS